MVAANVDYIYWAFSAAAQSIAAFIAFLLTGYALVHSLMESAREHDDTLEEVHAALQATYHKRLAMLAWLTGAAILMSLAIVYFNRPSNPVNDWLVLLVGLVDVAAVVVGLYFVVSMVEPRKYQRAAKRVIEEKIPSATKVTSSNEFFDSFLHLERLVREYLRDRDLYVPSRGAPRMSYSFRQMLEALRMNEKIDAIFYRELLELNKYRNLVFHGHVSEVDTEMVNLARVAAQRVSELH